MKKIVLFLTIACTTYIANAQQTNVTVNQMVQQWSDWAMAPITPPPGSIQVNPNIGGFEWHTKCTGYLFEKPDPGSSSIPMWIRIGTDPKTGKALVRQVNVSIPNPPSNWEGKPFNNPSQTLTYPNGSQTTVFYDPIPIDIVMVHRFVGGYGSNRGDSSLWQYTGFKWYATKI
jgi:hypothetical protein